MGLAADPAAAGDAFGNADQQDGGNDGNDEPENVQLEDVPRSEQAGDHSADNGSGEPEQQCGPKAQILLAGFDQAGEGSDDEPGDDESIMALLLMRCVGLQLRNHPDARPMLSRYVVRR